MHRVKYLCYYILKHTEKKCRNIQKQIVAFVYNVFLDIYYIKKKFDCYDEICVSVKYIKFFY